MVIMFKLVVLCSVLTFIAATPLHASGRIVNGTDAKFGEIPYIVLVRSTGIPTCGGSIIDERHILTAAQCVEGRSLHRLNVQYGVIDIRGKKNMLVVEAVYSHENFSRTNNYANDVAVIKVRKPIPFGEQAQKIVLPAQGEAPPGGQMGVIAGWGDQKSGGSIQYDLKRADLTVYTDEACTKAHGSKVDSRYHVCSGVSEGGKGQCSGDAGGPLYSGGKQVGIMSWSIKPCAAKGSPGVSTRVANYINWIRSKVAL